MLGYQHAANLAIIHPVLQVLEAPDIWDNREGQVIFTAATTVWPKVSIEMPFIEFGFQDSFFVHLMPEISLTDPRLRTVQSPAPSRPTILPSVPSASTSHS